MAFNPTRLEVARKRRGYTKRRLASLASISDRRITAYERGEATPPLETLQKLAKVLRFPLLFFERPDLPEIPEGAATWRSLSRMTASQRDRALAGGRLALEFNDWIEARFVLPEPALPDMRHEKDPEVAASALRVHWGLADKPIGNVVRMLEAMGVRVFSLAEDCQEVDAFSFWRDGKPFVFLNTMKSAERSRFDAAHELAHLVMHRHGRPDRREVEKEADRFAGAFLMPRSSLLAFAPRGATLGDLIDAKRHWRVAVSALAYRMHEVRLLSEWHYRTLVIAIQQAGYRSSEPEGCAREMSGVFEKMFRSLRDEEVSKRDLAAELGWPLPELRALIFQLVLSSVPGHGTKSPSSEPKPDLKVIG